MSKLKAIVKQLENKLIFNISNFDNSYEIYYSLKNTLEDKILLLVGQTKEVEVKCPIERNRLFFEVISEGKSTGVFSTRLLNVSSIDNFRDLGGYETEDGKSVKWGIFYRCASLGVVNEEDKLYLENMGIKTIFDFRSESEVDAENDIDLNNCKYINESGIKDMDNGVGGNENFDMFSMIKELMKNQERIRGIEDFLMSGYESMVTKNDAFKILFATLKDDDRLPLVFHCTAGKDRTGVAGALVLLALGVSEEKVIEDYCLSNMYREATNEIQLNKIRSFVNNEEIIESIKGLFMVRKEYILITLKKIKSEFGTFENYFINGLSVTKSELETFKSKYLNNIMK